MKQVTAEKVTFIYDEDFRYNELKLEHKISIVTDALEHVSKNEMKVISRAFITIDKLFNAQYIDYLFWFKDMDLNKLDKKVYNNVYSDDDFKFSINTYFVKNLRCIKCNTVFRGGLAIDNDMGILGNKELWKIKMSEFRKADKLYNCPNCGNSFNMYVVYVFV